MTTIWQKLGTNQRFIKKNYGSMSPDYNWGRGDLEGKIHPVLLTLEVILTFLY